MPRTNLLYYSPEYEGLFDAIQARVLQGIGPSKSELLCIIKWKLGRITKDAATCVRQNGETISNAILKAGTEGGRRDAIRALVAIQGVKMALASAFLTVCWPDLFTVLDWRALKELAEEGCATGRWPTDSAKWAQDVEGYLERYIPSVQLFQKRCGLASLRETDRVLWGRSVRHQIDEHLNGHGALS